ncbi:MAG: aminopeptidase 1 [Hyperionvirus sp.]|uniref:Aminopeptidase 1 n=1 Tax=Hyperionvirus sp. TaxID=2487770 RepID=A0A3G5ABQ4_9VIRU|nr:MAG: aminopeptidase 1 [Hyperionvirus sp.]
MIKHRLTKDVKPSNYELNIVPDLMRFTFQGTCRISFDAGVWVERIVLHSKHLSIGSVLLNDDRKCEVVMDVENELMSVETGGYFGKGVLLISYAGVLNGNMEGFYRSSYKVGEIVRYMGVTQFEAADARQAFPCFDEPNFKATFDLRITGVGEYNGRMCLSNMEVVKREGDSVWFGTSPVMSTYLLAWVIGDLEFLEREMDGVVIRAYCTPGKKEKLLFAINVAARALKWFLEWFEIGYPLKKLDLLAVPDFSAGAMENWGLITFRESLLFADEDTEISERQDIVNTICHEIAHQWFGNLVTMEWWTYLWLNESMATYFGWWVTDVLFPEYKIWDKFMDNECATALELDSLEASHPIEVVVERSSDIQQIFDAISYSKGSCLVRALVCHLGEKKFREGMRRYLSKHKYGNTVSGDLWDAFGEGVGELMRCWTEQTGYPVVSVMRSGGEIVFEQMRFLKSGRAGGDSLWKIPIEMEGGVRVMLDERVKRVVVSGEGAEILINPNRVGFFRVKYEGKLDFDFGKMSVQNKIQLISDCSTLCLAGYQEFQRLFDLFGSFDLRKERSYSVWNNVVGVLELVWGHLGGYPELQEAFMKNVMMYVYLPLEVLGGELGWDVKASGESVNDVELRGLVLGTLSSHDNRSVVSEGLERFRNGSWLRGGNKLVVLSIVGKHGGEADYDKIMELLNAGDNAQMMDIILVALAEARDKKLMQRSLDLVLSDKIREQDLWYYIKYLSLNRSCCDLIWDLVTKNWEKFLSKYPAGSSALIYLVKTMAAGFMSKEQLEVYVRFFKVRPEGTSISIDQTIEKITNKIMITERIVNDPVFVSLAKKGVVGRSD